MATSLRVQLRRCAPRVWLALGVMILNMSSGAASVYHLAPPPRGDDRHAGTAAKPWGTFGKALAALRPGDTLLLHGGLYLINDAITITCRGQSNAWITIAAAPGADVIVDAADWIPGGWRAAGGAVFVHNAAFLHLRGFTVRNSRAAGILVRGPDAEHIVIESCRSDRSYCPGIGVWHARHVRVLGCEVTGANTQELRPAHSRRMSEAPHEAISIASVQFFEVASNHVHHCVKEGIDIKETSAHGRVHHNYVHHVQRQGLYVDAWFGVLEDVTFDYNRSEFNGSFGMAVSVEGRDSRLRDVRIHDNELLHNNGSGLFFAMWGSDGPRSGIEVRRNTIVGNGGKLHWAGATGGIDVRSRNCRDVVIADNICTNNVQFQIATFANPADGLGELTARNIVISNNLSHPWRDDTVHPSPYGRVYALLGAAPITNASAIRARNATNRDAVPRVPSDVETDSRAAPSDPRQRTRF